MPPSFSRSVLAVAAGYLFTAVLVRAMGGVLQLAVPAHEGALVYWVSLAGGFVFAFAGGHTCARLARRAELLHAAVLAGIFATLGAALLANAPSGARPYALGEVAAGVLGVLAGGYVRARAAATQ
ncbi:MAG TPA: hypothetical protein VFM88_13630 [Vicinamibacteria bacterium]|nr:hypothetical protein [Vicinamibacteria bacterium]